MPNLADIDNLVLDDIKIGQHIRELKTSYCLNGATDPDMSSIAARLSKSPVCNF